MGKKRTAEDRKKQTKKNGFNFDDKNVNDKPVPRFVLEYTEKMCNIQTVRNHFRRFISGWNRNNPKLLITKDHTNSITNYIKGPLKKKIGLSDFKRPKTYITIENFIYMERQLWQSNGHKYVYDRYRILINTKLKCHMFTSARVVVWKNGKPKLRYSLKREFAKGMHDKEDQRVSNNNCKGYNPEDLNGWYVYQLDQGSINTYKNGTTRNTIWNPPKMPNPNYK
ncbi:uncharacterized protein PgNI_12187 [Pyricularia grisea]|uniref:WW domain-containing protein n=1 Tax=Pyricularia grisea TaxID=148305 RepID=A0A6P8AQX4_PYRGI|nr:uncharacterized protein PgNI_12187 [Pyricularia grisea]TLD04443.1 hypothetical protein PgNI_12187 [Pyricularia grisea]